MKGRAESEIQKSAAQLMFLAIIISSVFLVFDTNNMHMIKYLFFFLFFFMPFNSMNRVYKEYNLGKSLILISHSFSCATSM